MAGYKYTKMHFYLPATKKYKIPRNKSNQRHVHHLWKKQQKGKDWRFLQENWKHPGSIQPKDGTINDKNGEN